MQNSGQGRPPIGRVFNPGNIPTDLKALRRWAPWKAIWNEERGKWDKVPYRPEGYGLSSMQPDRWVSFEEAVRAFDTGAGKYSGVGLVLTGMTDVVGIDLDRCITDGQIAPWAQEIIDSVDSYTELSPSGTGLRILARGSIPEDVQDNTVGIEVYNGHKGRFLTVTGDVLRDHPVRTPPPDILTGLYTQYRKARTSAKVISLVMPELIHELALPDVQDMDIPPTAKEFLTNGPGSTDDRSALLHATGVQLYSAGYSDSMVFSILANNDHAFEIALSHRQQDGDRAMTYLWVEHCQKAKPKAITKDSILADFDDLTSDPEVVEAKKAEDRFKLETTEEFIVRRKASWIIKNVIPNANLGVIYGASGSGKSFFAFEMAAAIARGIEWRGHKTTKSKVCWVAAEGQEDMRKRVAGYCLHHGVDPKELTNLYFVANAPNMMELTDARALVKQIRIQGEFDLVVMDTLAQVMPGGNENSGEDMGKVLGHCKEITRLTGAMVELIHHSGKDESRGARGWSGLRAACDFEFEVIRADEERVAIITKLKGGADGGEFGFRLETIVVGEDDDGDEETTCVVGFTDSSRSSVAVSQGPTGKTQKAIMDQFRTLADLDKDGVVTEHELAVVVAASRKFDPTSGKRDKRVDNAKRDIRAVISGGFLQMDAVGRLSLPSA
ncbi:AAA domain containing protein [uncultured Caudovirales phage]|uniref:AAA domain containing protein n=1 Tax=uncultured Caudovirales phage TaxID=2100421 RepID=A0A6J5LF62_9CAUD|nr:AAA domain containing protein [uncultured Caudovirales phage]